jgi:hypothetical protein
MRTVKQIVWKWIEGVIQAIGILITFVYIFTGFGLLLAMCALEGVFLPLNNLVFIISLTLLILIIISWVILIIRWFKIRIKEETENYDSKKQK